MTKITALTAFAVLALAAPASADTLYQAGPPPAAPGHPMRLGADHKAAQVGDLIQVAFNFTVSSQSTKTTSTTNSYSSGGGAGSGIFNLPLVRLTSGLTGDRASSQANSDIAGNAFVTSMEAVVTDVLPSGALKIAGDQGLIVDGQHQTLHITGVVRYDDIDNTDSILSTRVADVKANFDGNYSDAKHPGILSKIVKWLF
jgi:flagellar L-ring protein precursor FlgH